jgi:hypothetical protein
MTQVLSDHSAAELPSEPITVPPYIVTPTARAEPVIVSYASPGLGQVKELALRLTNYERGLLRLWVITELPVDEDGPRKRKKKK